MQLTYGKSQLFTNAARKRHPFLARIIYRLLGVTHIGSYARSLIFRRLLKQVPVRGFRKILDFGCGFGDHAFMLAEGLNEVQITALDIDTNKIQAVEEGKNKLDLSNVHPHLGMIQALPQRDFDFIYSIDVFHCIAPEEMPFEEVMEHLKPGGFFLVKMPNRVQSSILPMRWFKEHQHSVEEKHIGQVFELYDLVAKFQEQGFNIIHCSYSDGVLARLAWEINYLSYHWGKIPLFLFLPLSKFLVTLDHIVHNQNGGNTIQVIGQKPN